MDLVSIFLNLSAIPDEVILNLEINDDNSTNFNEVYNKYLEKYPMKKFGSTSK